MSNGILTLNPQPAAVEQRPIADRITSWLSAALEDPNVGAEFKRDINEWFDRIGATDDDTTFAFALGLALSEKLTEFGNEAVDWFDSRNVDSVVEAILPVVLGGRAFAMYLADVYAEAAVGAAHFADQNVASDPEEGPRQKMLAETARKRLENYLKGCSQCP